MYGPPVGWFHTQILTDLRHLRELWCCGEPAKSFGALRPIRPSGVGDFMGMDKSHIKEVHDDIWLVSFMDYDLGYFDLETRVLEPLENPFGPKVLPMS